jgi:formylglycine-generating enzyme required for sulfatase activity
LFNSLIKIIDDTELNAIVIDIKDSTSLLGVRYLSGPNWEWCSDWYEVNYYEHSQLYNPQGASYGTMKVLRGGNWGKCYGRKLFSCRYFNYPEYTGGYISFRLAKSE